MMNYIKQLAVYRVFTRVNWLKIIFLFETVVSEISKHTFQLHNITIDKKTLLFLSHNLMCITVKNYNFKNIKQYFLIRVVLLSFLFYLIFKGIG